MKKKHARLIFLGKKIGILSLVIGVSLVTAMAGAFETLSGPCGTTPCEPPPECEWGYNPPAYLKCGEAVYDIEGFFDSLGYREDFLWWRASTEGVTLGSEESVALRPSLANTTKYVNSSYLKEPKFRFDSGFRFGITHICPCDCSMDAMLNWTHYHTKAMARGFSSNLPTNGTLVKYEFFIPSWERVADVTPDKTSGRWKLDLDLLDLEFGYKYYVCSFLALRVHAGLRGARIYQSFRVVAEANRTIATPFSPDLFRSLTKANSDFLGLGPRLGLDLEVELGCGLSLVGQLGMSLLYGREYRHGREYFTEFTPVEDIPSQTYSITSLKYRSGKDSSKYSKVTDVAVGLKGTRCFNWCRKWYPVSVAIMWEHHGFFDMTDFSFISNGFNFTSTPAAGRRRSPKDLYTQGLTVSVNVGF